MVRVEMMTVGKELLIGRTLNTNAHWVGKRLARLGTMIKEITTIDDDLDEISSTLKTVVARSPDFLIVIGGLGPTPDDMTLKGLAMGMGVSLSLNKDALGLIRAHYAGRGMANAVITPSRRKMATLPRGATPLRNGTGTAPGVRMMVGKTVVFSLPGVPAEMKSIFAESVEPEIKRKLGPLHRKYVTLKLEGVFESVLAPYLVTLLKKHPYAYIKSHPRGTKGGVSKIEVDIAVVGEDRRAVDGEGVKIAEELTEMVSEAGGKVKSSRGLTTGGRR